MSEPIVRDLQGQKFHNWTVVRRADAPPGVTSRAAYWWCRCACGHERAVRGTGLTRGRSKSCGCDKRWRMTCRLTKHGRARSSLYRIRQYMLQRCYNPKHTNYRDYGGRGIKVCDRWRESFENFLADVGERPSPKHSLDRIKNDGDYEPGNCRWATRKEQHRNMRSNIRLVVNGRQVCLVDLENLPNATRHNLKKMLAEGMTGDEMLSDILAARWNASSHCCD